MRTDYIRIEARLFGYFLGFCHDNDIEISYQEDRNGDLLILGWENEREVNKVLKKMERAGYK